MNFAPFGFPYISPIRLGLGVGFGFGCLGVGVLLSIQFCIALSYDNKLLVSKLMWSVVKCKQLADIYKVTKMTEGDERNTIQFGFLRFIR